MKINKVELQGKFYYSCTKTNEMDADIVSNFNELLSKSLIGPKDQIIGLLEMNELGEAKRYAVAMIQDRTFNMISSFFRGSFEWWVSEDGDLAAANEYAGAATFVLIKRMDSLDWNRVVKFLINEDKINHIRNQAIAININEQETALSNQLKEKWVQSVGHFW